MSDEFANAVTRRRLLVGAIVGGAGLAFPFSAASALGNGAGVRSRDSSPPSFTFFDNAALNFQMLFVLGAAGYGASEVGEVLTTIDRIRARGSGLGAVFDEFFSEGVRLRAEGDGARRRGLRGGALGPYLRSAMYFNQALFYVLATGTPTRKHEGAVYERMERSWALAAQEARPRFERVRIPYGRGTLPGWLLTAKGAGSRSRRPTIILNNGSDAQNIDMWVYGGSAALGRGWNALILEGPGQGANLFLHNIPFRPDWEKVIAPVVNFLRRRPEVDRRRISLAGQSFGGYLVLRAAAYEHRLAAVVADPGVVDPFVSWTDGLPPAMIELLYAGKKDEFDGYWAEAQKGLPPANLFNVAKRAEIYGKGPLFDQLTLARKFKLSRGQAGRVKAPTAVLAPEEEKFFPGQQKTAYDWLKGRRKLIPFTVAEGAQFHCEPMAPQLRNERVYNWLERNLEPTR